MILKVEIEAPGHGDLDDVAGHPVERERRSGGRADPQGEQREEILHELAGAVGLAISSGLLGLAERHQILGDGRQHRQDKPTVVVGINLLDQLIGRFTTFSSPILYPNALPMVDKDRPMVTTTY